MVRVPFKSDKVSEHQSVKVSRQKARRIGLPIVRKKLRVVSEELKAKLALGEKKGRDFPLPFGFFMV